MDNQNNQKPNPSNQDSATQQNNPQPNQEPQQPTPDKQPEDMLAGTDETPTSVPEPTATSLPTPPPRHPVVDPVEDLEQSRKERSREEPTPRHSELGSESNSEESNKKNAVIPAQAGIQKETETKSISESNNQPTPPTNQPPVSAKPETEPQPNKQWIWWMIAGIVILAGAVIYYFFFWQQGSGIESYTTGASIVYRASTIPSSTITLQNGKLILDSESLPSLPIAQYTYSLEFMTADGDAKEPQDFIMQDDGTIVDYNAEPITEFNFDETADYSIVQINVNRVGDPVPRPRVILAGIMPEINGEVSQLQFPVPSQQTDGQAFIKYDSKTRQYELEINLEQLSDVRENGWKYAAWLVEESGPYVTNIVPAGTFYASSESNKAIHTYTTGRDLSGFNKLVISLEPDDDTDEEIFAIRPFSSELVLR